MKNVKQAILFSLLGTACFTPVFAVGKIADGAFPILALMTLRYLGGLLTVLVVAWIFRVPNIDLKSPKPHLHFVRACLGAGGGVTAMYAASLLPLAYATSIGLTKGVVVVLLAGVFLHETIRTKHWLACGLSFVGAFVVVGQSINFSDVNAVNYLGVLTAFMSAIFIAIEVLFLKVLARQENALGVLLHVNGFGSIILIALCVVFVDFEVILTWEILPFALIGPLAILAQYFNIKAYRLADASILAPVSYSWIIFATLLGLLYFNEIPTTQAFFGSFLIVLGGLIVTIKGSDFMRLMKLFR